MVNLVSFERHVSDKALRVPKIVKGTGELKGHPGRLQGKAYWDMVSRRIGWWGRPFESFEGLGQERYT